MSAERQERQKLRAKSVGVASRRLLAEAQARAMAADPHAVVLVEGLSDCFAVEAAAKRFGRTLENERVVVVPMGGATNLGRFLAYFGPSGLGVRLAGLCDLAEAEFFGRTLDGVGMAERADRAAMASVGSSSVNATSKMSSFVRLALAVSRRSSSKRASSGHSGSCSRCRSTEGARSTTSSIVSWVCGPVGSIGTRHCLSRRLMVSTCRRRSTRSSRTCEDNAKSRT